MSRSPRGESEGREVRNAGRQKTLSLRSATSGPPIRHLGATGPWPPREGATRDFRGCNFKSQVWRPDPITQFLPTANTQSMDVPIGFRNCRRRRKPCAAYDWNREKIEICVRSVRLRFGSDYMNVCSIVWNALTRSRRSFHSGKGSTLSTPSAIGRQ